MRACDGSRSRATAARGRAITGSPPRLSTHPDRFLAVLHPPSRAALTSNPHSARCPAGAQLSATSVSWRFLDACKLSVPRPSLLPASKNLHNCQHLANLPTTAAEPSRSSSLGDGSYPLERTRSRGIGARVTVCTFGAK